MRAGGGGRSRGKMTPTNDNLGQQVFWLLILAIGVHVIGWLLISISLPRLPAAITSVVLTIQPMSSVFLGVWILAEAPSALQLLGVAFILAGLLLATVRIRVPRARRARLGAG